MHKKIMLEFPNGWRRWAYATTEHETSDGANPVVVVGSNAYSSTELAELGVVIPTNDPYVDQQLTMAGYTVILRDHKLPQLWPVVDEDIYQQLAVVAERDSTTPDKLAAKIITEYIQMKS